MSDKTTTILNEENMMERGYFTANGHTFAVKPVYLGEEDEYLSEMTISPTPVPKEDGEEYTEKELGQWSIALFSKSLNVKKGIAEEKHGPFAILSRLFQRFRKPKDYRYYADSPAIQPLVKWLERKVTYKNRKIRFYDLERKFGLNKAEIERLIMYFHELSGF